MTTEVRNRNYLRNQLKRKVHDEAPHIMYLTDIDMALYRISSDIMRIVEIKHRREPLRDSQRMILGKLAGLSELGIASNVIAESSGIFVVRWDRGDSTVGVAPVLDTNEVGQRSEMPLDRFLNQWVTCLAL